MRKSMTKRDVTRSHKIIREHLTGLGAEALEQSWSALAFRLHTPAGPLVLSMHADDGASVFGRFEDIDRAVACLGVGYVDFNHYSGKWNFHLWSDGKIAPEDVLARLNHRVMVLMAQSPPSDREVADVRAEREARYRERGWRVLP